METQDEKKGKKSVKGILFMTIGAVLVVGAIALVGYNMWDSSRAGESAAKALAVLDGEITPPAFAKDADDYVPDYQLDPEMEMPTNAIEGWDYIGKLTIPSLKLELPVLAGWSYPGLRKAPCRYAGSAYQGNMIIAAHNYARHFGGLKNLPPGAEVLFTDMEANEFLYEVTEVTTIQPTAIEEMTTGDWDLSLFTCTRGGAARVTVRCDRIGEMPGGVEVVPET